MKYLSSILFCFLILTFFSCEKERTFQLVEQEFSLTEDTLIFKSTTQSAGFFIKVNAGNLSYVIKGVPSWLYISNSQGQATASGTFIEFILNPNEFHTTTKADVLTVETPLGSKNVIIIFVPVNISHAFVQEKISILGDDIPKILNIFNPETLKISWTATIDNDYITLNKLSGSMEIGSAESLNIRVNKDKLPGTGTYVSIISFTAHGKTYKTKVNINNQLLGSLDRNVIDAVYASLRDEIYFVSNSPKSITRLQPQTNQTVSLNLDFVPISLAISQDNKTAVIGCDAQIIVVDLDNMVVIKTISVDSKVKNIVLAPNNFAYILTDGNSWVNFTEVNIATGNIKKNPSIVYAGSIGRLHPNGNWVYVADNGVSPSDVRKFSLANNGGSTYLYDSPYHGEYNIGGNLWFNEAGDKMLTGSVFLSTSQDETKDLRYVGSLVLPNFDPYGSKIWSAVHSSSNNRWYISLVSNYIVDKFSEKLYVFDSESFEMVDAIDMIPIFNQNSEESQAQPRFVFSSNNSIYVVNKAQDFDKWSVQILAK